MGNSDQLLLIYVVQLCISQFHLRPAPPPPPRATAGHLPAMSVPGVGHLQKKAERQKGCSVDEERGICPLFSSPPWGIRQLKSPHSREFAIQGKKNANTRGSARGGGGGDGRRWNWLMHYGGKKMKRKREWSSSLQRFSQTVYIPKGSVHSFPAENI